MAWNADIRQPVTHGSCLPLVWVVGVWVVGWSAHYRVLKQHTDTRALCDGGFVCVVFLVAGFLDCHTSPPVVGGVGGGVWGVWLVLFENWTVDVEHLFDPGIECVRGREFQWCFVVFVDFLCGVSV